MAVSDVEQADAYRYAQHFERCVEGTADAYELSARERSALLEVAEWGLPDYLASVT